MNKMRLILTVTLAGIAATDLVRYALFSFSLSAAVRTAERIAPAFPHLEDQTAGEFPLAERRFLAAVVELPLSLGFPAEARFVPGKPGEATVSIRERFVPLLPGIPARMEHKTADLQVGVRQSEKLDCLGIPEGAPGHGQLGCSCTEEGLYYRPLDQSCHCFQDHDGDGRCSCPPSQHLNLDRTACLG